MTFTAKAARVIATRPRLGAQAKRRGLNKETAGHPASGGTESPRGWRFRSLRDGLNQRGHSSSVTYSKDITMATSQIAESLSNLADDLEKSCERQEEKGSSYITISTEYVRRIIELLNEASSEIDGFINGCL